jgi:hypothetical protein
MSIRSRIGDFLFHLLFPQQAALLDACHDQLVDSAVACEQAREAMMEANTTLGSLRETIETAAAFNMRMNGSEV